MGGTEIFAQGLLIVTYLNVSGIENKSQIHLHSTDADPGYYVRGEGGGGGLFGEGSWELENIGPLF